MTSLLGVSWATSPLDTLTLLVGVGVLAAGTGVAGDMIGLPIHLVSEQLFLAFSAMVTCVGCGTGDTLPLRLPHAKLLRDEAVLDYLVNVLLFGEGPLVIEVEIAHLLADVWLVHALRMVPDEAMAYQALSNEVTVNTTRVRRGGPLLVTAWLDLVLAQQDTLTMYLLKGNVCRRKIIVINRILLEGIHWGVRARPSLIKRLLRHDALASLLLTHLQVLSIVRADLEVRRLVFVRSLSSGFVAQ